jgi:DNA polymerase-1
MKYLEPDENYWSLDIEADSLTPTQIWVVCVENIKTGEKLSFHSSKDFNNWCKPEYVYIAFNGMSYDFPALRRLWLSDIPVDRCIDPFLLSMLYDTRLEGGHNLASWGIRVKLHKIEFHDFAQWSPEMDEYCAVDATICRRAYLALAKRLRERNYSNQSFWIEHHFSDVIGQQERNGFQFNIEGAEKLLGELRAKETELRDAIRRYFPAQLKSAGVYNYKVTKDGQPFASYTKHTQKYPKIDHRNDGTYECFEEVSFNVGSPIQRLDRLLSTGWKPVKKTKSGGWSTDEESVLAYAEESGIPEVKMIAEWLVYNGRANMINTWLENVNRADSRIHGTVFSCGASSRRCTHSGPNTANIPSVEARFGPESRGLWTARPNRVLCGIDAAGLEGRILVHYLGGTKEAYDYIIDTQKAYGVKDFHTLNAQQITKRVIPKDRKPCKNDFYAMIFGAQDAKLGAMSGGDKELGAKIRSVLGDAVPGLKELMDDAANEFNRTGGYIRTIDGGWVKCFSPHAALNYRCQPCGAITMKLGAIILDREIRRNSWDALKVGDIHDEWQFDCDPDCAGLVGEAGRAAIKLAGEKLKLRVPLDGTYSIGRTWADTH